MKPNHTCKTCNPKIGIVILARNEGGHISKVIESLQRQIIKPTEIVLVNDGSTDGTEKIARECGVHVVDFPIQHDESWVNTKNLAKVVNCGLDTLSKTLDYYMILGGDHILSDTYIDDVITTMKEKNYSICSGIIKGEKGTIRGSGRIITREAFKSQGFGYKVNYGYETYMLFRAECDGFKTGVSEATSTVTRKTSTHYKKKQLYRRGIAYRALGYSLWFFCGVAVKHYWHKPILLLSFFNGYVSCGPETYYEGDLRKYVKAYQRTRLR